MSEKCCERLRGDLAIGPPLSTDGSRFDDSIGYGQSYGLYYGGQGGAAQGLGIPPMPNPMRLLGDATLEIEHDFKTIDAVTPNSFEFADGCSETSLQGVKIKITLRCSDLQNNALRFGVQPTITPAQAVANEILFLRNGFADANDIITFSRGLIDTNAGITAEVFDVSTNTIVRTMVQDVDYSIKQNGFRPVRPINLSDQQALRVSYGTLKRSTFTVSDFCNCLHSIQFFGRNIVNGCEVADQTGRKNFNFYRVQLIPDGNYEVMPTDKFSEITLMGVVKQVNYGGKSIRYAVPST